MAIYSLPAERDVRSTNKKRQFQRMHSISGIVYAFFFFGYPEKSFFDELCVFKSLNVDLNQYRLSILIKRH
ncbi:hypothetical protein [Pantoea sp. C2G6]|uniref:hypothetical protein n=1 Tax=Pantoea sp. C2G6 TaxID=3243084 RepID=UPI003ED93DF0